MRNVIFAYIAVTATTVASEDTCKVQNAVGKQWLEASQVSQNIAERGLQNANALQALMDARDWESGVPMIEQMTAEEAARFEELRQATINGQIASLIPSKRERDIIAIGKMAKIAEDSIKEGFELPADDESEDAILATIVAAARELIPMSATDTYPNADKLVGCELKSALIYAADNAAEEANEFPFLASAIEEMTRLNETYPNLSTSDESMTERDRKALIETRRIVQGAMVHVELANDYLRLALLEEVSQLLYDASMRDLFQSPGDLEAVGKTWQGWVEAGHVNERQVAAAGLLYYLNEQIPSDVIKNYDQLSGAAQ